MFRLRFIEDGLHFDRRGSIFLFMLQIAATNSPAGCVGAGGGAAGGGVGDGCGVGDGMGVGSGVLGG